MSHYVEEIYRTRICHWCRKRLKDGDKTYKPLSESLILCEECKDNLINPPDFKAEGTKEKGTTSWRTARILTLIRDNCDCRICGDKDHERNNPIEVHHIIPKKDGGTHNLKNLITLCEKHHQETFRNNYAGLKLTDRFIQIGVQHMLLEVAEK